MQNQILELTTLFGAGSATARVEDFSVHIETRGINGALKAWLVGGSEAVPIGNIVNGKLKKEIDTTKHTGILITQSGRHMFLGNFTNEPLDLTYAPLPQKTQSVPHGDFEWKKISSLKFPTENAGVKYILSNTSVYDSFLRHGYYWFGKKGNVYSFALPLSENEKNPFSFFNLPENLQGGFSYIFMDDGNKKIFTKAD